MQFYILMIDYGKKPADGLGPYGFEAVCNPEKTRRNIVSEVADILARGKYEVHFVKFVDGNFVEDVTADIINEAQVSMLEAAE